MKRSILFIFFVAAIGWLIPAVPPRAAQPQQSDQSEQSQDNFAAARRAMIAKRKMVNPHQYNESATARIDEAARITQRVAGLLPSVSKGAKITTKPRTQAQYDNVIDSEIFGLLAARGVEPAAPATDEEFCRRVYLDITGRQPTVDQVQAYLSSSDADKKTKLIETLINSPAYIDLWTNWLGDLTRNFAFFGLRDRNGVYQYLHDAVAHNLSFDRIASGLITYTGKIDKGPAGFVAHPIFLAELSQDGFDDAAAETARAFLGTPAVCVSCHNGAGHLEQVNLYLSTKHRSDFWGLAAFYARTAIDFHNGSIYIKNTSNGKYDANTTDGARPARSGGVIAPDYLLFGGGQPEAKEDPRQAMARLITSDPQFARAFVNRVFARFFTIGLVEPQDGFDLARLDPNNPPPAPWQLQASHPVLLNELGSFFRQSGYDLHALIKLIASSQAYALSARYDEAKWRPEYARLFARKLVRRLQAEEVFDAITDATQVPGSYYSAGLKQPFNSIMALPGVEDPFDANFDDAGVLYQFLQDFGRGDRVFVFRNNEGSITQALNLFNSELLLKRLYSDKGLPAQLASALAENKITPADAVTKLFLTTLGRAPRAEEIDRLKDAITQGKTAVGDLQWMLTNRADFLYNY